jgi:hypothetical protein
VTTRASRSLAERVRALGTDHTRALALVAAEGQRTAEQTEALMTDHRDTRRILLDVEARQLVMAGTQGEMLKVFRDMADEQAAQRVAIDAIGRRLATTTVTAAEARTKASGAHRLGLQLQARQSLTEEQVKAALDEAAAKSKAIVANPPTGAELRDLQREVLRGAKPLAPRVGYALGLFILAVLAYATAALYSCSPGGLP